MTTINYHRVGSGEPLLLTHGIGERWQYWLPVLPLLVDHYDVVAVDLPGFGESPELAKPWTLVDMQVALEELLDELGWDTAHVSGISMGGFLALQLGAFGRARSVTALSPARLLAPGIHLKRAKLTLDATYAGAGFLTPVARRFGKYGAVRTLLQGTNMQHGSRIPASLIEGDLAAVRAPGWAVARGELDHCNVTETGKLADIPVTVAFGNKDKILPPKGVDRSRLPASTRWVSLLGCGHTPTYDAGRRGCDHRGDDLAGEQLIFGLLHSPFVAPASSWGTLPVALADLGHEVVVVDAASAVNPKEYAWAAETQLPDAPLVLVAHSGAGLYVPVIAARRVFTWIRGAIFLDASLPGLTGESRLATLQRRQPLVAAALARSLYAGEVWPRADEPGWDSVTPVPRALAFHTEPIPVPSAGWGALPWAYLQTSDAYGQEALAAETGGHLVLRRELGHFAAVEASLAVATDLDAIAATF